MRFVQRLLRPIYRAFFERPIWWFLARVKAFFFAETVARLESIERRLSEETSRRNEWAAIEERLGALQAANAAQWEAIERLLLALFQQPSVRTFDAVPEEAHVLSAAAEVNGINGSHNLR